MSVFEKSEVKKNVLKSLKLFERHGTDELIEYLEAYGFFLSPASTRFHNAFEGGLAEHSYCVYKLFFKSAKSSNSDISHENIAYASLLHDLCKVSAYRDVGNGNFSWNYSNPKGHAVLSIERIEKFIELTDLEKDLIKFHMGVYGTHEFNTKYGGEYSLSELTSASNNNPVISLFHWCDDFDAKFGNKYFEKKKVIE